VFRDPWEEQTEEADGRQLKVEREALEEAAKTVPVTTGRCEFQPV